jgi:hypothetical protein
MEIVGIRPAHASPCRLMIFSRDSVWARASFGTLILRNFSFDGLCGWPVLRSQDIDAMSKNGLASLAVFYCDFREGRMRDLRGLVSFLLVQFCHQSDSYCDILSNFYLDHSKGSKR